MRKPIKRGVVMAEINITPFTDVVLVLLIIFMVSTPLLLQPGLKIKLPKANHAQMQKNEQLTVFVDKGGHVFLGGKEVLLADLKSAVESGLREAEAKVVVINADESVPLGLAVKVMDIAKGANAEGLVISIDASGYESAH